MQTLYDLGYSYIEEVRGIIRLSDGTYGTGDPMVGQHIFKTSGQIQSTSLGGALYTKLSKSLGLMLGLGVNQLQGSNFSDILKVESFEESFDILNCSDSYYSEEDEEGNIPAQYDCLITSSLSNANSLHISHQSPYIFSILWPPISIQVSSINR